MSRWLATGALGGLGLLGAAVGPDLALDLARPDPLRLLACHAAHAGPAHAAWSGGAALLFALALERSRGPALVAVVAVVAALVVGLAVALLERDRLDRYLGASGVAHALGAAWCRASLADGGRLAALGGALLAALGAKVGLELATGWSLVDAGLVAAGCVPVPVAHAAGLGAGLLVRQRWRSPRALVSATR